MQRFLRTTLVTGIPFGLCMGLAGGLVIGVIEGVRSGVFIGAVVFAASGLLFGLRMASFSAFQRRRVAIERPDFGDEPILHDGPANHFYGGEATGGWLYLTTRRLFFRSHRRNLYPHETAMELSDITEARPIKTAKVIPNGLEIIMTSGHSERFVVEKHNKWSEEINHAKNQAA
jgi:hypothetical protein